MQAEEDREGIEEGKREMNEFARVVSWGRATRAGKRGGIIPTTALPQTSKIGVRAK
jgi:hypothetical protein